LEGRRPGSPYPHRSKKRLRSATLASTPTNLSSFVGSLTAAPQLRSVGRTRTANRFLGKWT
jgi:hypothetical protein